MSWHGRLPSEAASSVWHAVAGFVRPRDVAERTQKLLQYVYGGHPSRCEADFASYTRRRCRALRREQRGALTTCSTPECMRVAGLGHHTCCAPCVDTGGDVHTAHCSSRQNFLMAQQTPTTTTTAHGTAAGSTPAEVMAMNTQ